MSCRVSRPFPSCAQLYPRQPLPAWSARGVWSSGANRFFVLSLATMTCPLSTYAAREGFRGITHNAPHRLSCPVHADTTQVHFGQILSGRLGNCECVRNRLQLSGARATWSPSQTAAHRIYGKNHSTAGRDPTGPAASPSGVGLHIEQLQVPNGCLYIQVRRLHSSHRA